MWVIRADVAGRTDELESYGSSGIVDPDGMVVQSARQLREDLIVAEIDTVRVHIRRYSRRDRSANIESLDVEIDVPAWE